MIPTHNCAHFLPHALGSVLSQDQGPERMQIEVVDDASEDDPSRIVHELGAGRIFLHRQETNVGHTRNFETCLLRSRGEFIHLLHGDDAVRPGFYQRLEEPLLRDMSLGAAFCRYIGIDAAGHWQTISELLREQSGLLDGWLERIALGQALQTPSIVVRREVYERLGGFDRRLSWTEDWEMWVRIAANYSVWYEAEPLALYRVHSDSSTGTLVRTGGTIRDARLAIELNAEHLPAASREALGRQARAILASTALRRARRLLHHHETRGALAHIVEALRTRPTPRILLGAAFVVGLGARNAVRTLLRTRRMT